MRSNVVSAHKSQHKNKINHVNLLSFLPETSKNKEIIAKLGRLLCVLRSCILDFD